MHKIIKGKLIDSNTRCQHYNSDLDIIAIKFKCCNSYYACIYCHDEVADHITERWNKNEFENKAIFCGNCKEELSINKYLNCGAQCTNCGALFNPKCSNHNHLYFKV